MIYFILYVLIGVIIAKILDQVLFPTKTNTDDNDLTRLIFLALIWPFLIILVIINSDKFK